MSLKETISSIKVRYTNISYSLCLMAFDGLPRDNILVFHARPIPRSVPDQMPEFVEITDSDIATWEKVNPHRCHRQINCICIMALIYPGTAIVYLGTDYRDLLY